MWLQHSQNHQRKLKPMRKIVICQWNEQVHMTKSSENKSHRLGEHCSHVITKRLLPRWFRELLISTGKGSQKTTQIRVGEGSAGEAEVVVTTGKRGRSQQQSHRGLKQRWYSELSSAEQPGSIKYWWEYSFLSYLYQLYLWREKVVLAIFYFF